MWIAGKYEIICTLGTGGFGTVFKVRHVFRKKYYALKTPHRQFLQDPVFRRRFEREIEAMERFVHPDAVMIRDCGVAEGGFPYYTMDFIEGESLKTILSRERRLAPDRALMIVRRVLSVLDAAHRENIIHRDIKPDNILITQCSGREQVKVLDFGVAKLLDLVGWTSITHDSRVGTPKYMSPEQITGDSVDGRSDLFSLGTLFYEMVTGEHPFARDNDPIRVTASILNRIPVPPRDLVSDLPRQISDRILWMLEKKKKRRPSSAQAVLAALPVLDGEHTRPWVEVPKLQVHSSATRIGLSSLVLRQKLPEGERRCFLVFKERITFGRSSESRNIENDLLLRCLPCNSKVQDPENWRKTLTISSRVGTLYPSGSALVIEPAPAARGGVTVNGVKSLRPVRIQADRFHLSLGDRALELDGHRQLRRRDRPDLDLTCIARGRPSGIPVPAGIGYEQGECAMDHVHLSRVDNYPLHEYFLVFRQVVLGSAADAGLQLSGEGIEGEHALLLFAGGEVFVTPLNGEVRIRVAAGTASGMTPAGGRFILPAGSLYPLVPGLELILKSVRLRAEAAEMEWFKKV